MDISISRIMPIERELTKWLDELGVDKLEVMEWD